MSHIGHELERTFGASKVDAGERAVDVLRALARGGNVDAHTEKAWKLYQALLLRIMAARSDLYGPCVHVSREAEVCPIRSFRHGCVLALSEPPRTSRPTFLRNRSPMAVWFARPA